VIVVNGSLACDDVHATYRQLRRRGVERARREVRTAALAPALTHAAAE
jgi:hypothetical protein